MGIDRCIASCTGEVLVLPVGNVQVRLGIAVFLSETKVDDVDLITPLANAHQEVVGLDIAVDKVTGVDVLDTRDLEQTKE